MTAPQLVHACRVPMTVRVQKRGLWTIDRVLFDDDSYSQAINRYLFVGYSHMTVLYRLTTATMMHTPHGESVMEDSRRELQRHLPILMAARGRVLVTGLGLGCVLRGLLAKPEVDHVDVVEIDRTILDMVGPEFGGNPRVTLHHQDALKIEWPAGTRWDYAWHDVWCEEGSLDVLHGELMVRYDHMCALQGAWHLKRPIIRVWPRPLLNAGRRLRTRREVTC